MPPVINPPLFGSVAHGQIISPNHALRRTPSLVPPYAGYLKSPQRLMALLMVMTLCLLVYAALEYRLRTALAAQQQTFPDQRGKEVSNPTVRWIFQGFTGIHVLLIDDQAAMILNITARHQLVIN